MEALPQQYTKIPSPHLILSHHLEKINYRKATLYSVHFNFHFYTSMTINRIMSSLRSRSVG